MTPADRLAEIRARAEAATPGPWREPRNGLGLGWTIFPKNSKGWSIATCDSGTDADFIAHAREDVPYLLERVAKLQEHIDVSTVSVDEWNALKVRAEALEAVAEAARFEHPYYRDRQTTLECALDALEQP